jgi:hypothetical protein
MAIETNCLGCGQRLRVADEHAGKKARCPNCQTINPIPGPSPGSSADAPLGKVVYNDPYAPRPLPEAYSPSPATSPTPEPATAPFSDAATVQREMWTLKIDDGRTFGPVDRTELDKWFGEGRITPSSQLFSDGDNRWRPAGEVYPSLGRPAQTAFAAPVTGNNPFADREAVNPYASPYTGGPRSWREPHNGVLILILGLLGIFFCGLFGPVAAYLGHSSLSAIRAGRMDPDGQGLVMAGTILGWIGTVLLLAGCGCLGFGILMD